MKFAVINQKTKNIDFFHETNIESNSYFSIELDDNYDYKNNYFYDWENIIKTLKEEFDIEKNEKQKLFSEYKSNLDEIKELNAEIQEVEATAKYFPEVAEKRIDKLTKDRTDIRNRNWQIIGIAIEKFWEEVINEF